VPVIPPWGVGGQIPIAHRKEPVGEEIAKRLARIAGHANSLNRFWEEGREGDEMLTQISAVRAALDQVGRMILEHNIEHCISEAAQRGETEDSVRSLKKSLDLFIG
jgi:DNA-binding FrmR family transcriptional regulator